jgi:hypothetical protein
MPKAVFWLKIYSAFLAFIYLAVSAASLFFFLSKPEDLEMSENAAMMVGLLFLLVGAALFAVCLVPLIASPQPWVWTYDLVILCMGFTSPCFLVVCVPLLVYWLKPETKAYFGRSA